MIEIYNIDEKYTQFLYMHDKHIILEHLSEGKRARPFVGAVVDIDGFSYYVPMTSPKKRFEKMSGNELDTYMIHEGTLGALNLNNMIPLPKKIAKHLLKKVDITIQEDDSVTDKKYKVMMNRQIYYLLRDEADITRKCHALHKQYKKGNLPHYIVSRCCKFPVLERVALSFEKEFMATMKIEEEQKRKAEEAKYKFTFTKVSPTLYTRTYDKKVSAYIRVTKAGMFAKIGYAAQPEKKWKKSVLATRRQAEEWCNKMFRNMQITQEK